MARPRTGNERLAAVIAEARLSHAQVAHALVRVAIESGAREFALVGRSHVSHWVAGSNPSGRAPVFLAEALSRRLKRVVTVAEIGLTAPSMPAPDAFDWGIDTLVSLADLGRADLDMERRHALGATAFTVAGLALPGASWWTQTAHSVIARVASTLAVGRGDLEAVREMTSMFSRIDQRRGGGHARMAVVQYLTSDVASYLRGRFSDEGVRRDMFSAASELAYLAGWMAFDNAEHAIAQKYFSVSVRLAAEADDPPMAAHVLTRIRG